jgi:hypothetical protein
MLAGHLMIVLRHIAVEFQVSLLGTAIKEHYSSSGLCIIHAPGHLKDIGAVDLDLLNRLVATTNTDASKLVNDILALNNLAEDGVLSVKVRGGTESDTKQ